MDRKFDRVRFLKGEMPTHTRDGHKIIKVLDSGLDVAHSMVAWIDGEIGPRHYTRLGFKVWCANPEDQILDPLDLVHSTKVVHTIGDVYEFQKDNATGKKFLLVKVGDDEIDKGPTVALFNMSTGIIWAPPIRVRDPYNLTDVEWAYVTSSYVNEFRRETPSLWND